MKPDVMIPPARAGAHPSSAVATWRTKLPGLGLVEAIVAVTLVCALWLPGVVGGRSWLVPFASLVALAAWRCIRQRRWPPLPVVLMAYLVSYLAAAAHGGSIDTTATAWYVVRPLGAIAVASLVTTAAQRRNIVLVIAVIVGVEVPVVLWQVTDGFTDFGRRDGGFADGVTGTLGAGQAGILTLAALTVAIVAVGVWLARGVATSIAVVGTVGLLSIGVLAGTRSVVTLVPASLAACAICCGLLYGRRPALSRLAAVAAAAIVAGPVLYAGIQALYPGAFVGLFSSQNTAALGGAAAYEASPTTTSPRKTTKPKATRGTKTTPAGEKDASEPARPVQTGPTHPRGVELLPGRFAQIRLALDLSRDGGVLNGILGRGLGSTRLDPAYRTVDEVPLPQRTGSTWLGVVLTEAGWLGLAMFAALLVWLLVLGRSLWARAPIGSVDKGLGGALPGLAALTALGAGYAVVLVDRGYSIPFWLLVGVAIAAARHATKKEEMPA